LRTRFDPATARQIRIGASTIAFAFAFALPARLDRFKMIFEAVLDRQPGLREDHRTRPVVTKSFTCNLLADALSRAFAV
jgi:hypothetical protein